MRCWKCGKEIMDGAARCPSCGATQDRPAPVTEPGRAMRMLYDRYGAQEVLKNSAYLANGLGDLAEDTKKLRNQLKMGMDAGMGKVYLEQLAVSAPDSSFDSRVKQLLTEDAGLNDKAAEEIARYFDEMIGWRSVPRPQVKTVPPRDDPQNAGKQAPGANEVDRGTRSVKPEPEIDRRKNQQAALNDEMVSPDALPNKPVPTPTGWFEVIILIALFGLSLLLTLYVAPFFSILMVIFFFIMLGEGARAIGWMINGGKKLQLTRTGEQVLCSWTMENNQGTWLLAVNGKWVAAGVKPPYRLPKVAPGSLITLAIMLKDSPNFIDQKTI